MIGKLRPEQIEGLLRDRPRAFVSQKSLHAAGKIIGRRSAESRRFDGDVAVRGVRGDREVRVPYPQVDGVCPDNDDRVTM